MCVDCSQNPMQDCKESPPPPAVLGEACDGLPLEALGEVTASGRAVPPELKTLLVTGGERGATAGACVIGALEAEGGVAVGAAAGADGVVGIPPPLEAPPEAPLR